MFYIKRMRALIKMNSHEQNEQNEQNQQGEKPIHRIDVNNQQTLFADGVVSNSRDELAQSLYSSGMIRSPREQFGAPNAFTWEHHDEANNSDSRRESGSDEAVVIMELEQKEPGDPLMDIVVRDWTEPPRSTQGDGFSEERFAQAVAGQRKDSQEAFNENSETAKVTAEQALLALEAMGADSDSLLRIEYGLWESGVIKRQPEPDYHLHRVFTPDGLVHIQIKGNDPDSPAIATLGSYVNGQKVPFRVVSNLRQLAERLDMLVEELIQS